MKHGENTVLPGTVVWLAVSEDSISLLELRSMQLIETYMFGQVLTFGGCQDDFMLVIASDSAIIESHKLLFSLSKPKVGSNRYYVRQCFLNTVGVYFMIDRSLKLLC